VSVPQPGHDVKGNQAEIVRTREARAPEHVRRERSPIGWQPGELSTGMVSIGAPLLTRSHGGQSDQVNDAWEIMLRERPPRAAGAGLPGHGGGTRTVHLLTPIRRPSHLDHSRSPLLFGSICGIRHEYPDTLHTSAEGSRFIGGINSCMPLGKTGRISAGRKTAQVERKGGPLTRSPQVSGKGEAGRPPGPEGLPGAKVV
jgi:hypothetical protein